MKLRNDETGYGLLAKAFHWSVALLVMTLLPLGTYMQYLPRGLEKFRYVELHKSLGLLVLVLMIGRTLWVALNPQPPLPVSLPAWERMLARMAHWAIYAALFLQLTSGVVLVWTANSPLTFFGWFVVPSPLSPDRELHEVGEELHELFAYGIFTLLLLHIGAALRHHFILKNDILRRMLGVMLIFAAALFAAPLNAATWNLLPSSKLLFHFTQSSLPLTGTFERFEARIDFDPDRPEEGRRDVMIDIASLDTQNTERDTILRSAEMFDAEKFPQAQFVADKIRAIAPGKYEAVGVLTIRDISQALILPFDLKIEKHAANGDQASAAGSIAISRRDFGLARGQWEAADIVADEVKIEIRVEAAQQR